MIDTLARSIVRGSPTPAHEILTAVKVGKITREQANKIWREYYRERGTLEAGRQAESDFMYYNDI